MRGLVKLPLIILPLLLVLWSCTAESPLFPDQSALQPDAAGTSAAPGTDGLSSLTGEIDGSACWGQATRIFAAMGEMGEHASQEPTPRLGLRNLARALYESGAIPDDSMKSLGQFVADELGLSIDACM